MSVLTDNRLTDSQKVTRAEWFIMELKDRLDYSSFIFNCENYSLITSKVVPNTLKVNAEMFSRGSKSHVGGTNSVVLSSRFSFPCM